MPLWTRSTVPGCVHARGLFTRHRPSAAYQAAFPAIRGREGGARAFGAVNSRAKYTGQLAGVEGDNIVLDVDGTRTEIPFQLIKKAHVIATIDFNAKKG